MRNPVTGEPVDSDLGRSMAFATSCRLAYMTIAKKAPTTTLHDLMRKTDECAAGEWLELSDEEWKLLEHEMLHPNGEVVNAAWVMCAQDHQRAILDAKRERPAVLKSAGNSAEVHPTS